METLTLWCGFIGAWLLVAGPIHQAALELHDEASEIDHIDFKRNQRTRSRVSAWWWLIPPVKVVLAKREADRVRQTFIASLSDDDARAMISFINKSTGWLYVALGGLLLAVKESYELVDHFDISGGWLWPIVIGLTLVITSSTAARIARSERIVAHSTDTYSS